MASLLLFRKAFCQVSAFKVIVLGFAGVRTSLTEGFIGANWARTWRGRFRRASIQIGDWSQTVL